VIKSQVGRLQIGPPNPGKTHPGFKMDPKDGSTTSKLLQASGPKWRKI